MPKFGESLQKAQIWINIKIAIFASIIISCLDFTIFANYFLTIATLSFRTILCDHAHCCVRKPVMYTYVCFLCRQNKLRWVYLHVHAIKVGLVGGLRCLCQPWSCSQEAPAAHCPEDIRRGAVKKIVNQIHLPVVQVQEEHSTLYLKLKQLYAQYPLHASLWAQNSHRIKHPRTLHMP